MKKTLSFALFLFAAALLFCEEITFSADTMSGRAGSKEDSTKLSGNARVVTETIEITADSIELSGKEFRYVGASGNIKGSYKESNLEFECSELQYDRESKVVVLSGDVQLIDKDNEVTAGAQMIEYNSNTDIAVLQIEVSLKQKKNVCTSAYAIYRKKEQMLELNGSAKVVQDDDSFAAHIDERVASSQIDSYVCHKTIEHISPNSYFTYIAEFFLAPQSGSLEFLAFFSIRTSP